MLDGFFVKAGLGVNLLDREMRFNHGRLELKSSKEMFFSCLRIPAESGNVTQFVKGLRVVGIEQQFLLQFGLGLVEPLVLPIKRADGEVDVLQVRFPFQHIPVFRDSIFFLVGCLQQLSAQLVGAV